jgi:hypothetical protein
MASVGVNEKFTTDMLLSGGSLTYHSQPVSTSPSGSRRIGATLVFRRGFVIVWLLWRESCCAATLLGLSGRLLGGCIRLHPLGFCLLGGMIRSVRLTRRGGRPLAGDVAENGISGFVCARLRSQVGAKVTPKEIWMIFTLLSCLISMFLSLLINLPGTLFSISGLHGPKLKDGVADGRIIGFAGRIAGFTIEECQGPGAGALPRPAPVCSVIAARMRGTDV